MAQIRLYIDEDSMDHALVRALRARGVDVVTALDVGLIERADSLCYPARTSSLYF